MLTLMVTFLDKLASYLPEINMPSGPQTIKRKLLITFAVALTYAAFYYFFISVFKIELVTPGFDAIVAVYSITFILVGLGWIKFDANNSVEQTSLYKKQKVLMLIITLLFSAFFAMSEPNTIYCFIGFILAGIPLIYLDDFLYKYGITSGINVYIISDFAVIFIIIFPGLLSGLPDIIALSPFFIVALISVLVFKKIMPNVEQEAHMLRERLGELGRRLPQYILILSLFGFYLADVVIQPVVTTLLSTIPVNSIATYSTVSTGSKVLIGGISYLISAHFPLPYPILAGGIGGLAQFLTYLFVHTSPLYINNGVVAIPEWAHLTIFATVYFSISLIIVKFFVSQFKQKLGVNLRYDSVYFYSSALVLLLILGMIFIPYISPVVTTAIVYLIWKDYQNAKAEESKKQITTSPV